MFCGFMLPKSIKTAYQHHFPEDTDGTSLSNWGKIRGGQPINISNHVSILGLQTFVGKFAKAKDDQSN